MVAVTHSPLLRAVLLRGTGSDPGEPGYVTGADIRVSARREPWRSRRTTRLDGKDT